MHRTFNPILTALTLLVVGACSSTTTTVVDNGSDASVDDGGNSDDSGAGDAVATDAAGDSGKAPGSCRVDSDCTSGLCYYEGGSCTGKCSTDPRNYACAVGGTGCDDKGDCCSGECLDSVCTGSSSPGSCIGTLRCCTSSSDCCSNNCVPDTNDPSINVCTD